ADVRQRLLLRAFEKAASVDDDEIGAGVIARQLVTFRAQPGDDALGIDQRLRAAERDEGNAGRRFGLLVHWREGHSTAALHGDTGWAPLRLWRRNRADSSVRE